LIVKACAGMPLLLELAGAQLYDVDATEIWQVCAIDEVMYRYLYTYEYMHIQLFECTCCIGIAHVQKRR
jgi:hypothetical protein